MDSKQSLQNQLTSEAHKNQRASIAQQAQARAQHPHTPYRQEHEQSQRAVEKQQERGQKS